MWLPVAVVFTVFTGLAGPVAGIVFTVIFTLAMLAFEREGLIK